MKNFVFKMNLNARFVEHYTCTNELDYLVNEVIPNALESMFELIKRNNMFLINFEKNEVNEFSEKYNKLELLTEQLLKEYSRVIEKHRENGSVNYPKEFLSLTSKCGYLRNRLIEEYPMLAESQKISDDFITSHYHIPIEKRVGTAISHLKRFNKIKYFLEKNGMSIIQNNKNTTFYYPEKEYIIVGAKTEESATAHIRWLNNVLNSNGNIISHIGKVQIVPVYEKFFINGKFKTIEYTVVYPNGSSRNRHQLIQDQLIGSKGDEQTTSITANEDLDSNFIQKMLKPIAEKGYLKMLKINGKYNHDNYKTEIKTIDLNDDYFDGEK